MSDDATVEKRRLNKSFKIIGLLLFAIAILVALQLHFVTNHTKPTQVRGTQSELKKAIVHRHKLQAKMKHVHTEKISTPIKVSIESDLGLDPADLDESFELTGVVGATMNLNNVEVKWVIPEGVEILSGAEVYTVSELNAGESHTSRVVLKVSDLINHKIHFSAGSKQPSMNFASVAQYNTQLQRQVKEDSEALQEKHSKFIKKKNY